MRLSPFAGSYLLVCAGLISQVAASFSAEVNRVPDFSIRVKVVGVLPITCPPDLDCRWIEEQLGEEISSSTHARVVPAAMVRKAVFENSLDLNQDDAYVRLFDLLAVDTLAIASTPGTETKGNGAVGVFTGSIFLSRSRSRKSGTAELLFLDRAGKKLLEGSGYGTSRSRWRTEKGLVVKIYHEILQRAFER